MNVLWTPRAWEEYLHWQAEAPELVAKINALVADLRRHPFTGIGKPEPLKRELAGLWSRRISQEHRLVYRVTGSGDAQRCEIVQCRYHY